MTAFCLYFTYSVHFGVWQRLHLQTKVRYVCRGFEPFVLCLHAVLAYYRATLFNSDMCDLTDKLFAIRVKVTNKFEWYNRRELEGSS